jgi:hypothetical protein
MEKDRPKRSSSASGRGKVPPKFCGFWVAIRKKGDGSSIVLPQRSCGFLHRLQKRRLGAREARLSSSANTKLAAMGPGL